MDLSALIKQLNQTDETTRIEAKRGSGIGKAILKSVVAFANAPGLDGGHILLGLERDAEMPPSYSIRGVEKPDKLSADLSSQCASMLNRRVRPHVETAQVEGQTVMGVYVPESPPSQKPVYFENEGWPRGAYRRIGSTDQQCTDDDWQVFAEDRAQESYDGEVLQRAEWEDFDADAIGDYRETRAEADTEAQELKADDEQMLRALTAARRDDNGDLRPTVAGVLLFGSKLALRRLFPQAARIDYMRVPGREWMQDPDRHLIHSIEIRVPLMQAIRRAQAAVLDDLPKSFSMQEGDLQRTEEPRIPLKALREAIVNAVMHRDYRRNSAVQIIRYANRLEIRNPGYSLVAPSQFYESNSESRNSKLADVLHDTRFAETKGLGMGVIREEMREAGLAPPEFDSNHTANRFVTTLYLHHFLDPERIDWLEQFKHLNLSKMQVRGLVHAREAGRISNAVYRDLNGLGDNSLKASNHLGKLRDAGLLEMKGGGTATYYEPTEKLLAAPDGDTQPELPFDGETPQAKGSTQEVEAETSGETPQTSGVEGETSGVEGEVSGIERETSGVESKTTEATALPDPLQQRVEKVRGKRAPRAKLQALICDLCAWQPLSASEVAEVIDKSRDYIASQYMVPLVEAGRLERTIPEKPTHRNQKYRAVDA
jgi:ATP-dependent DNA helicase RecG